MPIAKKFARFDMEITAFAKHVDAHAARLRVTPVQNAELQAQFNNWQTAFGAYENYATRTRAIVATTYAACTAADKVMRGLRQQIKHTYKLELSADDTTALRITRAPAHRGRAKRQLEAPFNTVRVTRPGIVEFTTKSPLHIFHSKLPPGAREIVREVAYLQVGAPPAEEDFHLIDAATHARHLLRLPQAVRGRGLVGWLRTRFANSHGEAGPASVATQFAVL